MVKPPITKLYYYLKPFIPRRIQILIRRKYVVYQKNAAVDTWPILESAGSPPDGWTSWPQKKKFALVLTHDVESKIGQERCLKLMKKEDALGFKSSFNFVPERYSVSSTICERLVERGFEVGVHGLNHDGKLFASKSVFDERAVKINKYLKRWKAVGFRAPAMHHNLDWIADLYIQYDASTFDTDPFQPNPVGVNRIFPFWVEGKNQVDGYVELPYTLPQDFDLFVLLKEKKINIWQKKIDWIVKKGGMVLLITHPDYMSFNGTRTGYQEYPVDYYIEFLKYIQSEYAGQYWHILPKEMAVYWSEHFQQPIPGDFT